MQSSERNSIVRALVTALMGLAMAAPGCAPFNMRGETFRDDLARWNESQRRPAPPPTSDIWSFSEQARQVERNLGVK